MALETAIIALPKVKEAAVIAIPDKKWLERPLACIVLSEGQSLSIEELRKFLSADFANYQLPDSMVILKEIPKTSVGKFDKKEMRRLYALGKLK
jgi:fatty-acyl-CoA synthase